MRVPPVLSILLCLLYAAPAEAQRFQCGGRKIHWIGGPPVASFDRDPEDHAAPSVPEPPEMTDRARELWDALVFDAYDRPTPDADRDGSMGGLALEDRRTLVLSTGSVSRIKVCIDSPDESLLGERLVPFARSSWWRASIRSFTNTSWANTLQVGDCPEEPENGWINVREGTKDEFEDRDDWVAYESSWRRRDPHGIGSEWVRSEIVWNPAMVAGRSESSIKTILAHELGHTLGFWHAPFGSGFVMQSGSVGGMPEDERWLAQWAYRVGPNVQYPGFVREGAPVPALPLVGSLLLLVLIGALHRRVSRASC